MTDHHLAAALEGYPMRLTHLYCVLQIMCAGCAVLITNAYAFSIPFMWYMLSPVVVFIYKLLDQEGYGNHKNVERALLL